jgi:hypothetical protein
MLEIYADSHGRKLSELITQKSNHRAIGMVKPNAKALNILENTNENTNQNQVNTKILLVGSNDIYVNESNNLIGVLESYLQRNSNNDIILCTIPLRYDLPYWSILNEEIRKTNTILEKMSKAFNKVALLDISNLGKKFYTRHGQHFNMMGKSYISERIIDMVTKVNNRDSHERDGKEIVSPTTNQGN